MNSNRIESDRISFSPLPSSLETNRSIRFYLDKSRSRTFARVVQGTREFPRGSIEWTIHGPPPRRNRRTCDPWWSGHRGRGLNHHEKIESCGAPLDRLRGSYQAVTVSMVPLVSRGCNQTASNLALAFVDRVARDDFDVAPPFANNRYYCTHWGFCNTQEIFFNPVARYRSIKIVSRYSCRDSFEASSIRRIGGVLRCKKSSESIEASLCTKWTRVEGKTKETTAALRR